MNGVVICMYKITQVLDEAPCLFFHHVFVYLLLQGSEKRAVLENTYQLLVELLGERPTAEISPHVNIYLSPVQLCCYNRVSLNAPLLSQLNIPHLYQTIGNPGTHLKKMPS